MKNTLYHLHTISALHVGIGQGIGVVDMPIARERASNLPLVPGSGIKGVLRNESDKKEPADNANDEEQANYQDYLALFGPEAGDNASEYAGALAVGDARLLCLPIRSWKGTFAWVTCPMVLQRYQRDLQKESEGGLLAIPVPSESEGIHTKTSVLQECQKIYLEDLDLTVNDGADDWADYIAQQVFSDEEWVKLFKQRFLIVANNIFDFLTETATEIRARIKIEQGTRTVKSGALWYEEYLPAETLLWGIITADKPRNKSKKSQQQLLELLPDSNKRLQIGGNATIGAGQVRWMMGVVS